MRGRQWIWLVLVVGVLYLVVGLVSASLAGSAATTQARTAWRLAAWVISAIAFAMHIRHEHVRLRSSPATTAVHAALAVGVGAFGLAVAASLHAHAAHKTFPSFALAVWPVMTALPAFVVAFVAVAVASKLVHRSS